MHQSVRPARDADIEAIVQAHLLAFPGFFLSTLGAPFLRVLYAAFLHQPDGVLLVCEQGGRVAGFAGGTTHPQGYFARLLRRQGIAFALAAMPALLRHPGPVLRRLVAATRYRGEPPPAAPDGAALLSTIGVLPELRGSGGAQALVQAYADAARRAGCTTLYLTTDRDGNEDVNRFYARLGFALQDSLQRDGGRHMNRWVRTLGAADAGQQR